MPWWTWLQEALFPPRCVICKREGGWLCLKHNVFPDAPKNEASVKYLDEIFAVTAYYHPTSQAFIEYFKFRGFKNLADIMAQQIIKTLPPKYLEKYTLVPVPLHWTRKLWRGFNQAEEIAKALQRLSPKTPLCQNLKRIRKTQQQSKLKRKERLKNLTSAFLWEGESIPKNILLVDDVVASGSTLDSAAKVLQNRGTKHISGVVFARGGKPCQNFNNET